MVLLVPTTVASAIPASNGIVDWGGRYGLPAWLISDGGRHFNNHALRLVSERLGLEHHITLAYCAWANGAIEVVNQDFVYTIRAILSEFEMPIDEWDEVVPLIQYVINHRPRDRLGGRSPIEVMTGRTQKMALDLALWVGVKLEARCCCHRRDRRPHQ